jgi:hypothetical protein
MEEEEEVVFVEDRTLVGCSFLAAFDVACR